MKVRRELKLILFGMMASNSLRITISFYINHMSELDRECPIL